MAKKVTKRTKKVVKKTAKGNKTPNNDKPTKKVNNPKVKIDEDFKSLLTPLTTEEYKKLKDSIDREGCREPLIVWKGKRKLVDGHHRREICNDLGKKYRIKEMPFVNEDEIKQWIWNNQEGRRNLSPFRRVEVTLQLKDIIAKQAKEEQDRARKRKGKRRDRGLVCPKLDKPKDGQVHTDKILAKKAGVSKNTFRHAESIVKEIGKGKVKQKDIDELRSGKAKINTMYNKYCLDASKTKGVKGDISERSDRFFKSIKTQLDRFFPQSDDSNYIYQELSKQLSAWANEAGIEEPSE